MSAISIVMMLVALCTVWGGLGCVCLRQATAHGHGAARRTRRPVPRGLTGLGRWYRHR